MKLFPNYANLYFDILYVCYCIGMVQLEFQLHPEPEEGIYKIKMRRDGQDVTEQFEVKEYGKHVI